MQTLLPIKIKTGLKVSQCMPYLNVIAQLDGLKLRRNKDMAQAYGKFLMLLIICEQNQFEYTDMNEFRYALKIYNHSLKNN